MQSKRNYRVAAAWLATALVLGCGSAPAGSPAVQPEVLDESSWVDEARVLSGDGATEFTSAINSLQAIDSIAPTGRPLFLDFYGFDTGSGTSRSGDYLLSLSRYAGLVSTRVSGSALALAASVPVDGLPVGLFVSEGVAAVLVVDAVAADCMPFPGCARQTGRVVLVDVQDPAQPRRLSERSFEGTLYAARQAGSQLHLLTAQRSECELCDSAGGQSRWLTFDRSSARLLPAPTQGLLEGNAFFGQEHLLVAPMQDFSSTAAPELRWAELSNAAPRLSGPVPLRSTPWQIVESAGRLLVTYRRGDALEVETFELQGDAATSLGQGVLEPPAGDSFGWLSIEGNRAVTLLQSSGELVVLDLSLPGAPRSQGQLDLSIAESRMTLSGDRLLAIGRSTLPADAPSADVIARGPQAVVLVDLSDPTAPRALDRVNLGSFDSESGHILALRSGQALLSHYDQFPTQLYGEPPQAPDCGRSMLHLSAFDVSADRLVPSFDFDHLDSDAQLTGQDGDWLLASSVSVSRYVPGTTSLPAERIELTRYVEQVRALPAQLALFGVDFASNGATLELLSANGGELDVPSALGLGRTGCAERRRWGAPVFEQAGLLYALRFHRPASGAGSSSAVATLHVLDPLAPAPAGSNASALELDALAQGEDYLRAVQLDGVLLVARARRELGEDASRWPASLFSVRGTDPTYPAESSGVQTWPYVEGLQPDYRFAYDVIDLSDPGLPVLAARLDIDPELTRGGFLRALQDVTVDTPAGFFPGGAASGPAVVSGSLLISQRGQPIQRGIERAYLERFDFAQPSAPERLEPINIPGSVLDFDAATGSLLTLEQLFQIEPGGPSDCEGRGFTSGYLPEKQACNVGRRVLNALRVSADRAERVGRLSLDTDERRTARLAVSHGQVFYLTEARGAPGRSEASSVERAITLERAVLRDGRLTQLPSLDVSSHSVLRPFTWETFAASGERAFWSTGGQLIIADFSGAEPRVYDRSLAGSSCTALDVRGDTAYCALGQAGFIAMDLAAQ